MYAAKFLHNISPKCRLQLNPNKRSVAGRKNTADFMSNQFQKILLNRNGGKLQIGEYRDALKKVTGKNINIHFEQLDNNSVSASISPDIRYYVYGNSSPIYTDYNGFVMNVKKKKEKLCCSDSTLVHETRHLFDLLCNPKYLISRHSQGVTDKKLMSDCCDIKEFASGWGRYKPKYIMGIFKIPTFEKELREKIKKIDNEMAIKILQISRYHLQSEKNAYLDSDKFYLKQVISNPSLIFPLLLCHIKTKQGMQFSEKERVLKKLIKELIHTERFKNVK